MDTPTLPCQTSRDLIAPISEYAHRFALKRRNFVPRVNRVVAVFVLLICACARVQVVAAQDAVLPQDLASVARQLNCEAVRDFYGRPGMVHPPFVYGLDTGDEEASATFWCQRVGARSFLLVVLRANGSRATIPWTNFPGGLSLTQPQEFDLSTFRRVGDTGSSGPNVIIRGARAIKSYYDGVTELFVEHEGSWYVKMID